MSLKTKTFGGILWSIWARLSQDGLGFLTTLILARLLSPVTFGLLGIVTIFMGLIAILQDLGLGSSIVQAEEIDQEQLSGIFWFNLILSMLLVLLAVVSAPFVASFYDQPAIVPIMTALALNFPITALALIPNSLLRKRLMFKKLALIQSVATGLGSAVGITLAFIGLGVWALIWQQIAGNLTNVFLQILALPWWPSPKFSYPKIKKRLYFGLNLQISSIFNYGTRNADDFLISKVVGPESLGIYQMAYRMMLWPLEKVTYVVSQVMFPAMVTVQNDKERVKRVFLKSTSSIAMITYPMVFGIWVVAPSVVYTLLGEKWAGVIPIFQVLCVLGLTQSINANAGSILLTQGRSDLMLKLRIVFFAIYLTSFIIGVNWGSIGVAVCYTLTSLLLTPVYYRVIGQVVDMTFLEVLRAVAGVFFCALMMAVAVWGLKLLLPANLPHAVYLIIQIPFGVVLYGVLVHVFNLTVYRETRQLILEQLQLRFPAIGVSSRVNG
jgi:PST family polysaccharide transporter